MSVSRRAARSRGIALANLNAQATRSPWRLATGAQGKNTGPSGPRIVMCSAGVGALDVDRRTVTPGTMRRRARPPEEGSDRTLSRADWSWSTSHQRPVWWATYPRTTCLRTTPRSWSDSWLNPVSLRSNASKRSTAHSYSFGLWCRAPKRRGTSPPACSRHRPVRRGDPRGCARCRQRIRSRPSRGCPRGSRQQDERRLPARGVGQRKALLSPPSPSR